MRKRNYWWKGKAGAFALSLLLAAGVCQPATAMAAETESGAAAETSISQEEEAGEQVTGIQVQQAPDADASGSQDDAAAGQGSGISEPAVDPKTTAPNNVNTVVTDGGKKGTDISYKADAKVFGMTWPLSTADVSITSQDVKDGKKVSDISDDFSKTTLGDLPSGDLVLNGDLSIKKQDDTGDYDSTNTAAYDAEKDQQYSFQADLEVTAVHRAIAGSANLLSNTSMIGRSSDVYVNNVETGLRATFTLWDDLDGSFYVPTTLADAQQYYRLTSADGGPLIYRINYANSTFSAKKVDIVMDFDLTQMTPIDNQYFGDKSTNKLYGTDDNGTAYPIENYSHTESEYDRTYNTSVFGNFEKLITSSARKINLFMDGITLNSATGNKAVTETDDEITTTTQGTVNGTLMGYVKADFGHNRLSGHMSYIWGAVQNADGRDVKADADSDDVSMTVQFTDVTKKDKPVTPDKPDQPDTPDMPDKPDQPDTPVTPDTPNTPINPSTPDQPSNPDTAPIQVTPGSAPASTSSVTPVAAKTSTNTAAVTKKSPQTGDEITWTSGWH